MIHKVYLIRLKSPVISCKIGYTGDLITRLKGYQDPILIKSWIYKTKKDALFIENGIKIRLNPIKGMEFFNVLEITRIKNLIDENQVYDYFMPD